MSIPIASTPCLASATSGPTVPAELSDPAKASAIIDNAKPFTPPNGTSTPLWFSQSLSISVPRSWASESRPLATAEVAMSITRFGAPSRGTPAAIGLVAMRASDPPGGATSIAPPPTFMNIKTAIPSLAAWSQKSANLPAGSQFLTVTAAMPWRRVRSISKSVANGITKCP